MATPFPRRLPVSCPGTRPSRHPRRAREARPRGRLGRPTPSEPRCQDAIEARSSPCPPMPALAGWGEPGRCRRRPPRSPTQGCGRTRPRTRSRPARGGTVAGSGSGRRSAARPPTAHGRDGLAQWGRRGGRRCARWGGGLAAEALVRGTARSAAPALIDDPDRGHSVRLQVTGRRLQPVARQLLVANLAVDAVDSGARAELTGKPCRGCGCFHRDCTPPSRPHLRQGSSQGLAAGRFSTTSAARFERVARCGTPLSGAALPLGCRARP